MVGVEQERPRELRWYHAAGLLFGDWGTSRLYVLGLAFIIAGKSAFWLVAAMCVFMTLVGVCYGIVCGHFPDGAGVYTVGRRISPSLGVIGALLLLTDCVLTASLSAFVAFRYILPVELGADTALYFAAASIVILGIINYFGMKRAGAFAAVVGGLALIMYLVLGIFCAAKSGHADVPLPSRAPGQSLFDFATIQWTNFVGVILVLSGIESIASMTGVIAKPVGRNARLAAYVVLAEVVVLNLIMAYAVNAMPVIGDGDLASMTPHLREDLRDHMVKILAMTYVGQAFAQISSVIFGILLISAANTAIANIVTLQYLMSRDGELPSGLTRLNRHGMPKIPLVAAVLAPAVLLIIIGADLEKLADLYAVGVVGAIAINLLCAGVNRDLPLKLWQKYLLFLVGIGISAMEVTICIEKPFAMLFAGGFIFTGLLARAAAKITLPKPVPAPAPALASVTVALEPLPAGAARFLVASRGNMDLIKFAIKEATSRGAILFILFVREVMLAFRERGKTLAPGNFTVENDGDASRLFENARQLCTKSGIRMVPIYVVSDSPAEVILDNAATLGIDALIMGATRRNPLMRTLHGDIVKETLEYLPKNIQLIVHGGSEEKA